jgi:ABC-2 type transport system ATP-binding protein
VIGASAIDVDRLTKRFGARIAVQELCFQVEPGEVFGLLGPNGAGKTTTVRVLTGLLSPTLGDARVCGLSVRSDGEALRRSVGLLTENPGLYDRLTARENLSFFIKLNELEPRLAWSRAAHYLARFGLEGREDEPCGSFSKGMRQKLAIVRALVHGPQVLFLDEPTSGLDPEAARTVRDAIAELARDGSTIVLCSHNLAEVEQLCRRVAVLKGRLLAVSSIDSMRRASPALEVRLASDAARLSRALGSLPFAPPVSVNDGVIRVGLEREDQAADVIASLASAGARIYSAVPVRTSLEQVYLELIRKQEAS